MKWPFKKGKYSAGISPSPPIKLFTPDIDDIPESDSISDSESDSISDSESFSVSDSESFSVSDSLSPSSFPDVSPSWAYITPSYKESIIKRKMTKPIIQESPEEKEKREKLNVRDYKREVDL